MRVPKRKSEELARSKRSDDRYLTPEAIGRMERAVARLKDERPALAEEVARTQAMGDLSENAAYQEAKHRLRRLNARITGLEDRIRNAIPIETGSTDGRVRIGSVVTVSDGTDERTYRILGSQETDPSKGRVSHLSPLGSALMGHSAGDTVEVGATRWRIDRVR